MRRNLIAFAVLLMPGFAFAASSDLTFVTSEQGPDGSAVYSVSLQVLLFMTMLSMLPAALMTMTSFTRIIIVLSILRQALGMMQTPSNQIIIGVALFTTFFIMSPVFEAAYENGLQPYMEETIDFDEALQETGDPFHNFMTGQARDSDVALFSEMGGYDGFDSIEEIPFRVLIFDFDGFQRLLRLIITHHRVLLLSSYRDHFSTRRHSLFLLLSNVLMMSSFSLVYHHYILSHRL